MKNGLASRHLNKTFWIFTIFLAASVLFSASAIAAKCVRPNGNGGCFDSIQDAIDAVAPGGTIRIYPGIYYEYLNINKHGLTIEGMGNKRTDVRIDTGDNNSNVIDAPDVTVKNLTIQSGTIGIDVWNAAANAKIIKVNIFNSLWYGIGIDAADDILIKNCKISNSGTFGVTNSNGERLTVQNTTILRCETDGIYCGGDGLTVEGCIIKNTGLSSIAVLGSQATIRNNQLFKAGERGIYAISDFMKVMDNSVKETGLEGLFLEGIAPVIKKNTVMHSQHTGFRISCNDTCSDSKVINNRSSYNNLSGFSIVSYSSGMLIKKNRAFSNDSHGFSIIGQYTKTILENQAKYNRYDGFSVSGNGILENNLASENKSSGFDFEHNNTATGNRALNNINAGFYIYGGDNTLRKNRAIGNLVYGIYILGSGHSSTITNNTALDNPYDICDEGSANTWTGNDYDTECP